MSTVSWSAGIAGELNSYPVQLPRMIFIGSEGELKKLINKYQRVIIDEPLVVTVAFLLSWALNISTAWFYVGAGFSILGKSY